MSEPVAHRKPYLVEFQSGRAGPPATAYRGGAVKVIAALIYEDGVLIEWLMKPMPDLSWVPLEDPKDEQMDGSDARFQDRPELLETFRRMRRVSNFWEGAALKDDLGTQYDYAWDDSASQEGGGYKGRIAFSPAPPVEATQLTLRVDELAITVAVRPD